MAGRVLLLSAYDAQSHQRWRQGLINHLPQYDWTVLTLPARYFNWRIRGNALSWAMGRKECLSQEYDFMITTSMTDLATLRGLVPGLCSMPALIYFHENQFAYPAHQSRIKNRNFGQKINHNSNEETKRFLQAKVTSLYSALAADYVIFNSNWNRDSFLSGVAELLKAMPDAVPPGIVGNLTEKSSIIPVPLEDVCFYEQKKSETSHTFTILWNHRWEYDKAPERFFAALLQLKQQGFVFKVNVVGQQFRSSPKVFNETKAQLENEIVSWGYVDDESLYRQVLRDSDVVVSTALHDFQGLAILEAVAAGCIPVVPDRLAYQQFIPDAFLFPSFPDDNRKEERALTAHLINLIQQFNCKQFPDAPSMEYLRWDILKSRYQAMLK